jgi:asparagine synthase (glutamine-hydrolysing)
MCGIFAAVGPSLDSGAIENVFEALHHRGPDGRGVFVDESAGLTIAHTRLAIIDLVTGAQPMESEDGSVILSANGEIYDFERIRAALEAKGYKFKTKSDSEIIIYLYKEYGLGCFEHLRGEFAFLNYDREKRLLIAARDRFGIKPLYLSRLDNGFVFGSEMKAIFASGLVQPKLDALALDPFLEQDAATARFPFERIEHVPPGCSITVDLDTLQASISRYWSAEIPEQSAEPLPQPFGDAPAAAANLVLQQLEEAVRLRLRADVPVGLYLSGGIDSAFVGALMKRNLEAPLHSFSIGFVGSGRNEQELAEEAAAFIGTEHHELAVTKQALWDNLEQCLWFSELPFVSLAPVGKFLLSQLARSKVTVVLTGEGADEVFLGYRSFFANAIRDTRSGGDRMSVKRRRLKLGRSAEHLSLRLFHKSQRKRLASARAHSADAAATKPLINAVQEARVAAMPLDILAFLGDREEMAHSLEARLPFLDHYLYDAAKFIPVDLKMRDGIEKAVLRDAAEGILPDAMRRRRKSGFMLTSDAVDFFGTDRAATKELRRRYLSRNAFERSRIFSYSTYRLVSLVARAPLSKRTRQLRRNANKVMMYMMQAHMLEQMFVTNPAWRAAREA